MSSTFIPIFIVGIVFSFSAIVVATVFYSRYRERRLWHETIRLALEKGQAPPPEWFRDAQDAPRARRNDLSRGVILLALGAGISLFLWTYGNRGWGVGFILLALGLGFVASHLLTRGDRGALGADQPSAR